MYDYIIADIRLRSDRDLVGMGLRGFKPFATDYSDNMAECTLRFVDTIDMQSLGNLRTLSESYIADSDSDSSFYATNDGYLYSIVSRGENQYSRCLHTPTRSIGQPYSEYCFRFG